MRIRTTYPQDRPIATDAYDKHIGEQVLIDAADGSTVTGTVVNVEIGEDEVGVFVETEIDIDDGNDDEEQHRFETAPFAGFNHEGTDDA